MIEAIKLVGAILGFVTFGWALWDRLARHWPSIELDRHANAATVMVHNLSSGPISVSFKIEPATFWIVEYPDGDDSPKLEALYPTMNSKTGNSAQKILIASGSVTRFRIASFEWPTDVKQKVKIEMDWQPMRNRLIWLRPARLHTTVDRLNLLKKARG